MMVVLQAASGETWKLEPNPDALVKWYYKPDARRPRKTRVPKARCRNECVQDELEHARGELLACGFWESSSDDETEEDIFTVHYSVDGKIDRSCLPEDLQRVANHEGNKLVVRPQALRPIELPGDSAPRPLSSGTQHTLEGLIGLLRIQDAIERSASGTRMRIVIDDEDEPINPKAALKRWPELEPTLEEHSLITQRRLSSPAALDWFF